MKRELSNKVLRFIVLASLEFCIMQIYAQPSWVKKATKSVFTLKTFAADGSLIGSSNGFFTGTNGEAVSNFAPFKGASKAIVIDTGGKEMQVESILGINDMYDVVKFRVNSHKTQPLTIASSTAPVGSIVWLLPYRETKNIQSGPVRKTEKFLSEYDYYTIAMRGEDKSVSCPLFNASGEVIGLLQQPMSEKDSLSYAVSARFADSLKISALSINDPTFKLTHIMAELPDNIDEAIMTMFIAASSTDSATYISLVENFIRKFPYASDGYVYRAQTEANNGNIKNADEDMRKALDLADPKDGVLFTYARLIYNQVIYQENVSYDDWNLYKSLELIRAAKAINNQPTYAQLEADILYAQQQYDEAYQLYHGLTTTDLNKADLFFRASKCKEMLKDTVAMIALLDSAVTTFSKPYLKEAAPYLWARSQARRNAKMIREAIVDMNEYEELMKADVNDNFYYIRHQMEIEGRLYQQALNDINRAIQINPQEVLYYAEKASLLVRVGLYDEAITTAKECISIAPDNSDGYLFLGVAYGQKGNKQEALVNLQKAKELGDDQVDALIEKYK